MGSTSPRGGFPSVLDDSTGCLNSLFLRDGVGISDPVAQALARRVVVAEERVRVVDRLGRERGDLGVSGQARFPDLRAGRGIAPSVAVPLLGPGPATTRLVGEALLEWQRVNVVVLRRCSVHCSRLARRDCPGAPSYSLSGRVGLGSPALLRSVGSEDQLDQNSTCLLSEPSRPGRCRKFFLGLAHAPGIRI